MKGLTQRMLDQAYDAALEGPIVLVGVDARHLRSFQEQLVERGAVVDRYGQLKSLAEHRITLTTPGRFTESKNPVFIDHAVHEMGMI